MKKLMPVTSFCRWDNDNQMWTHNHIEYGHITCPTKVIHNGRSFKYTHGFLDENKKFCDGSIMMDEPVNIVKFED